MECPFFSRTGAYLDRELPAAEREAYEAHLSGCRECARELARLERLSRFLSVGRTPEFGGPRPLWKAELSRQRLVRFAEVLTAAAAVVIAVCGFWLSRLNRPPDSAATPAWERLAVAQQSEPAPSPEPEDPMLQVLLRGEP
jgi:anti-sigma factor RsiW